MCARTPEWYKGKLVKCVYCDAWYGEKDIRIKRRDGKWVCYLDFDTLTDVEREAQIQRRKR